MDRSETVTLFNDVCVLSPAALVDAPITWDEIDAHHVMGQFTRGAETVSAELVFDDAGDLVDFISDDRSRASSDGTEFELQRWSTPLSGYRRMGGRRLSTVVEPLAHTEGEYAYLISTSTTSPTASRRSPTLPDRVTTRTGRCRGSSLRGWRTRPS